MINTSELGEISIGYKYLSSIENRPKITDTIEAYRICKLLIDADKIGIQEQFVILYLNNSNVVIGSCNAFTGGLTGTVVDIKIVVATALKLMASGVIICHNHPSGNTKPSTQDITLTKKIKSALEFMDMKLIDHIIITPFDTYTSFTQEGLL